MKPRTSWLFFYICFPFLAIEYRRNKHTTAQKLYIQKVYRALPLVKFTYDGGGNLLYLHAGDFNSSGAKAYAGLVYRIGCIVSAGLGNRCKIQGAFGANR